MRHSALLSRLDTFTECLGRAVSWLLLIMMLVQFAIVILRYAFNINSIVAQESVMFLHAVVFMLAASYTLKHDGHVRVDIFYRRLSMRGRAWIDLLGTLLLLFPVLIFIAASSLGYVAKSWAILERSPDSGIPVVFLLKSLILVMVVLLSLQGIAQMIRQVMMLRGRMPSIDTDKENHNSA
ncbi:TRAP-type mannitol/chloroaromatic compound transport system, small permease component [Aidingimonas halophila]|uniref:TRAP transporter small permease protein n=2 Tax=Aidingimonas halophila TaxID=574349 RepID=A0A1H2Y515_9GAMM|nr:TRAP transporter small permease subunit [Aidingimonas halophila]GHC34461.1 C4-dicarboxylate ABC transporter substrate-binding protein [Aidingimonas halophila]SDX00131.1 TRAP-type mannitol/chloroaromatic compound transport system, small permease component [Aidingimonas halophila]